MADLVAPSNADSDSDFSDRLSIEVEEEAAKELDPFISDCDLAIDALRKGLRRNGNTVEDTIAANKVSFERRENQRILIILKTREAWEKWEAQSKQNVPQQKRKGKWNAVEARKKKKVREEQRSWEVWEKQQLLEQQKQKALEVLESHQLRIEEIAQDELCEWEAWEEQQLIKKLEEKERVDQEKQKLEERKNLEKARIEK